MPARCILLICAGLALVGMAACAPPRAQLHVLPQETVAPARVVQFWAAKLRHEEGSDFGLERPRDLRFERHRIGVPEGFVPGRKSFPGARVNPARHLTNLAVAPLENLSALVGNLRTTATVEDEVAIFVHGYNTNHAEAVYGTATMIDIYQVPVPVVLFSWPGAAKLRGYVYDRDSSLLSRRHLEEVILALYRDGRRVTLLGHSMGSFLIMETLRQMAHKAPGSVDDVVDAVVLLSPDIDPEVFRDQLGAIGTVPEPFVLVTSARDGALKLSGVLTGRDVRVGSLTEAEAADLPVTFIDLTAMADGQNFNHTTFASSPAARAFLNGLLAEGALEGPR